MNTIFKKVFELLLAGSMLSFAYGVGLPGKTTVAVNNSDTTKITEYINGASEIKNSRGQLIVNSYSDANAAIANNLSIKFLKDMAEFRDEEGNSLYDNINSILSAKKSGIDANSVNKIRRLRCGNGKPLFDSAPLIEKAKKVGIDSSFIEQILGLNLDCSSPLLCPMTLIDLKNLCSQGMYYKKNKDEIEAFDHRAKNELITIKHISELQECSGIPLKFTASDIGWIVHQFWRTDINTDSICSMVKTVNELDIRTGNISSDIVGAVNNKMCVADIKGYATVKDDSGKPLYSLSDMIRLKQEDISSNGLEHLIKLKGKDGKPFLGIDEIKMMQKAQSDILLPFGIGFKLTQDYEEMSKYIAQLIDAFDKSGINYPLDNAKIVRYTQLRLPIKDIIFNDTKKPNALIVYPISDNAAYYNLYNGVKFIRNIISRYDVQLIIAKDKDDVYNAIDYIPNIEFLCLAGHGKRYELNLSEGGYDVSLSKLESRGKIDTSDSEFADHLRRLNPGAVIYLFSCSTGEGGDTALNLANKIAEWSDNRKVISFTGPTAVGFFTSQKTSVTAYDLIKSYYPFDMVKDGRIHSNR